MRLRFLLVCCLFLVAGLITGCGRSAPQMAAPNRKLLEGLQSAVSSKKLDWLDAITKQIFDKYNSKEMSETEFRAFDAIIQKARTGEWKQAQMESFALSDRQRPTSQEVAQLKSRKSSRSSSN